MGLFSKSKDSILDDIARAQGDLEREKVKLAESKKNNGNPTQHMNRIATIKTNIAQLKADLKKAK
ncbi:MAG: hypothetical protein LBO69_04205 [Ignavibacteria bacterium]|jgi:hypothetical protein|nr:hypothetical protein [Ignavibacteria bacterium]